MRVSELSDRSGVTVATIKYYLREGLLPSGQSTSVNQTQYSDEHVRRLALIRALVDVGGLPIATAREVLIAADNPALTLTHVFGVAQRAISDASLYESIPEKTPGSAQVDEVLDRMNWTVSDSNPGRHGAARVLDAYRSAGHPELAEIPDEYVAASELIARADLASLAQQHGVSAMAETVVVGTVLGDALLSSLRRIAQEHLSNQLYARPASQPAQPISKGPRDE